MQYDSYVRRVPTIASRIGIEVPTEWRGIDSLLGVIDRIRLDGAVFILKVDGERQREDDNGQFTVIVSGSPLGDDPIRVDAFTLEEALAFSIVEYAERVWK